MHAILMHVYHKGTAAMQVSEACHGRGCDRQWHMQARFWDGNSLEQRKSFSKDWKVESVSYCPERSRFVVGGEDMYAHLYDYETGNELECNRGMLV